MTKDERLAQQSHRIPISRFFKQAVCGNLSSRLPYRLNHSITMTSTHELKADTLFSVKGCVCLVTGGGTGIGLMATQALAANGSQLSSPSCELC